MPACSALELTYSSGHVACTTATCDRAMPASTLVNESFIAADTSRSSAMQRAPGATLHMCSVYIHSGGRDSDWEHATFGQISSPRPVDAMAKLKVFINARGCATDALLVPFCLIF